MTEDRFWKGLVLWFPICSIFWIVLFSFFVRAQSTSVITIQSCTRETSFGSYQYLFTPDDSGCSASFSQDCNLVSDTDNPTCAAYMATEGTTEITLKDMSKPVFETVEVVNPLKQQLQAKYDAAIDAGVIEAPNKDAGAIINPVEEPIEEKPKEELPNLDTPIEELTQESIDALPDTIEEQHWTGDYTVLDSFDYRSHKIISAPTEAGTYHFGVHSSILTVFYLPSWNNIVNTTNGVDGIGLENEYGTNFTDMLTWLQFNNASVIDYSGRGQGGTVNGNVTWNSTTKLIKFSEGNNTGSVNSNFGVINISNYPYFNENNFSISFWILAPFGSDSTGLDNNGPIISNALTASAVANRWSIDIDGTNQALRFRDANDTGGTYNYNYVSTTLYSGWHHAVLVRNYSAVTWYIDGVFYPYQSKGKLTNYNSSSTIYIGSDTLTATFRRFNGSIDEIKIVNRSLSSAEIYSEYRKGLYVFNQTPLPEVQSLMLYLNGSASLPRNMTVTCKGCDYINQLIFNFSTYNRDNVTLNQSSLYRLNNESGIIGLSYFVNPAYNFKIITRINNTVGTNDTIIDFLQIGWDNNLTPCISILKNTSVIYGSCDIYDLLKSNVTQYDQNECPGILNLTYNFTQSCNYCTLNTSYHDFGFWSNPYVGCGNRTRDYMASNFPTCCNVTDIKSDCLNSDNGTTHQNFTYVDTELYSCDSAYTQNSIGGMLNDIKEEITMLVLYGIFAICLALGLKYVSQILLLAASVSLSVIGITYMIRNNFIWNLTGLILLLVAIALFLNLWFFNKQKREYDEITKN